MKSDSRSFDYEPVLRSPARPMPSEPEPVKAGSTLRHKLSEKPASPELAEQVEPKGTGQIEMELCGPARGHSLTFAALFVYSAIAYFRPFDLSPALSWTFGLSFWIAIAMVAIFVPSQVMLEGRLTARPREVNLVLLLGLVAIISIPQAISLELAWKMFSTTFAKTIIVFIVMVNVVRTELRLKAMMLLTLVAGGLMSTKALIDYAGGRTGGYQDRVALGVSNMFGEPNSFALHLVLMLPIAIALLLSTRTVFRKIVYAAGILVMFAGVLATQSRGGFIGLVASGLALTWKLGRRQRMLAITLFLVAGLAAVVVAPAGFEARLATILNISSESSASARQALLWRSISVALHSPFLGVGIGNSEIVLIQGQVSHNAYTQIAAEMGLIALAFYLVLLFTSYRKLHNIELECLPQPHHSRYFYLSIGLQSSLVAYMVSSFFLSVAYDWYVYILIGYALAFRRIYAGSKTNRIEPQLQG
ncbi:MAG TPA: O-antigen ligase family protein [Pyrinomonadaceae bacterium]|nr:O-antigen ligase family protein [Pyrinomonadaceae bacterium]